MDELDVINRRCGSLRDSSTRFIPRRCSLRTRPVPISTTPGRDERPRSTLRARRLRVQVAQGDDADHAHRRLAADAARDEVGRDRLSRRTPSRRRLGQCPGQRSRESSISFPPTAPGADPCQRRTLRADAADRRGNYRAADVLSPARALMGRLERGLSGGRGSQA